MKKGKKYLEAVSKVDKTRVYTLDEAVKLVKGAIVLPNGTGKEKKVLVIAKGDNAKAAKEAGADYVGDTDMLEKIEKENWLDFDVMIATPDMMPLLGKLGKVLGPKGLMPNPKTGTVTTDVKKAVSDVKKGRVEYKTDSYGNVHALVGKVSFTEEALMENIKAFVAVILKSKPSVVKGVYVKNVALSTTMGPGIKLDINSFDK